MSNITPLSLRAQTILVVSISLILFYVASLALYVILSASTVTIEREEQVADRIVTVTRLIEHASPADRVYLASQLSGPRFRISVDPRPLDIAGSRDTGAEITRLIGFRFTPAQHQVAADYLDSDGDVATQDREIATMRISGLFRIHETLLVSIDMPDNNSWLNFKVSGSAWDHIFAPAAIPSLALMAIGTIIFVSFAVSRPLRSLSRFAAASEAMGRNVQAARPIEENGPVEIRNAAHAFNTMQSRVQRLLEARSEMLGAISHDFRTPLTRLRLRVENMRDDEQRDKAIRDLDEMETLIKFTLDFVRDEAMEEPRGSVNLASLLRSLVSDLDPTGAMVTIEVAPDINIVCQPIGLRRVLGNVIENGVSYGDRVLVSATMHEDGVTMDVDDAGPGIKPADRERVFLPFYRLETSRSRETGGTGLGLSIAQTIVHSHGGSIELHDSPLGGLRVRIMLPMI